MKCYVEPVVSLSGPSGYLCCGSMVLGHSLGQPAASQLRLWYRGNTQSPDALGLISAPCELNGSGHVISPL